MKDNMLFHDYFSTFNNNGEYYLVEELIDPNLEVINKFCDKIFDIFSISGIGLELFNIIQKLHNAGYVYIELNQNNISIILKKNKTKNSYYHICLIDFGFITKYINEEGNYLSLKFGI